MAKKPSPPTTAGERLMGIEELAEMLGVSVQTVYEWRRYGRGPRGYKVGRYVKFRLSEIELWLEQQRDDGR